MSLIIFYKLNKNLYFNPHYVASLFSSIMIVIKRHFLFCCHKTSDDYFGVTAAVIIETGFFSYDNFEVCVESQNKILKFIKQLTKKIDNTSVKILAQTTWPNY